MAVDNAGATVNEGDLVALAGVVREIETVSGGHHLVVTSADGKHSMRVRSSDVRRIAGIPPYVSELDPSFGSQANGDILVFSGGAWTLLPVGAEGHVLTIVSGVPQWAAK